MIRTVLAAVLLAALLPVSARAASDDQKSFAYGVVERNTQAMNDMADSLYYFGELGMQEVESTKLVRDTMTAAGFNVELGGAGMPTNFWAKWGSGHPYIVIETEVDALPGGSQTPDVFAHKPLVDGAPRSHGGAQHALRRLDGGSVRREADAPEVSSPGNGGGALRSG